MKKILVMSALVAISAAFVACSSDDDLAQQPKSPETIVDTPKGTPFSVQPTSGATRAARYNADAWNGTSKFGRPWVREFKLYGKQGDNVWMNNVVFQRTAYNQTDWKPVRDASGAISKVCWPADDPATTDVVESAAATDFYAITDNAIQSSSSDALANVSRWMAPTVGQFDYVMPTTTKANMEWILAADGQNGVYETASTAYVDSTQIKDLMVASASTNEAGTDGGVLDLEFKHVLAGLTVKAKFLSNQAAGEGNSGTIKYIKVCGLKTSGTYTFGSGWSKLDDYVIYYKEWTGSDKPVLSAQEEGTAAEAVAIQDLVCPGEWLAIPQSTSPWDVSYMDSAPAAAGVAYIAVRFEDDTTGDDLELWYPLNITLTAAKNKVLTIDLGQFFEPYDKDTKDNTKAAQYYKPTSVVPTT